MNTKAEVKVLLPTDPATTSQTAVKLRRPGAVTAEDLMPVLDLAAAVKRRNFLVEVTRHLMTENVDFGVIPGAGSKPTLLKPGAEKLCSLYGLSPELTEMAAIEDWNGAGEGHGEPLFYYRYKCKLTKNGILLGEGIGSCNSRETKYRYRAAERRCPKCGSVAIIRGKEEFGGGWLCFAKKGGCGAKFKNGDGSIEGQPAGRVINADIADQLNTLQKMAAKRALIAAVLLAINASEFFSQDLEDLEVIDVPSAQPGRHAAEEPQPPRDAHAPPTQSNPEAGRPWRNFKGMIDEFAKLHGRLGSDYDHLYRETLKEYGVERSNDFKDSGSAIACYNRLLKRVLQIEAAAREDIADGEMPADAGDPRDQPPPEPEDELASASIKHRLEQFARLREAMGDAGYYNILGAHGFAHANEIKQLSVARAIYRQMTEALDYQTARGVV